MVWSVRKPPSDQLASCRGFCHFIVSSVTMSSRVEHMRMGRRGVTSNIISVRTCSPIKKVKYEVVHVQAQRGHCVSNKRYGQLVKMQDETKLFHGLQQKGLYDR